ncbi:hypothetical protein GCM10022221_61370 [Actinocorallia aurea]
MREPRKPHSSSRGDAPAAVFGLLAEWSPIRTSGLRLPQRVRRAGRGLRGRRAGCARPQAGPPDQLTELARALPAPDPARPAEQLLVLVDGAIAVASAGGRADSVRHARAAAETLVAATRP